MPYSKDLRDPNIPKDKWPFKLARKEEQTKLLAEIMKSEVGRGKEKEEFEGEQDDDLKYLLQEAEKENNPQQENQNYLY